MLYIVKIIYNQNSIIYVLCHIIYTIHSYRANNNNIFIKFKFMGLMSEIVYITVNNIAILDIIYHPGKF